MGVWASQVTEPASSAAPLVLATPCLSPFLPPILVGKPDKQPRGLPSGRMPLGDQGFVALRTELYLEGSGQRPTQHSAQMPAGRPGTCWRFGRILGQEMALGLQHYHEIVENGEGAILRF